MLLKPFSGPEKLLISAESNEGFLSVSIANTGSYILEDNLNKIFESGYTYGKRNGTGLGLSICKKFIESHGGWISCHSNQKKWDSFYI